MVLDRRQRSHRDDGRVCDDDLVWSVTGINWGFDKNEPRSSCGKTKGWQIEWRPVPSHVVIHPPWQTGCWHWRQTVTCRWWHSGNTFWHHHILLCTVGVHAMVWKGEGERFKTWHTFSHLNQHSFVSFVLMTIDKSFKTLLTEQYINWPWLTWRGHVIETSYPNCLYCSLKTSIQSVDSCWLSSFEGLFVIQGYYTWFMPSGHGWNKDLTCQRWMCDELAWQKSNNNNVRPVAGFKAFALSLLCLALVMSTEFLQSASATRFRCSWVQNH